MEKCLTSCCFGVLVFCCMMEGGICSVILIFSLFFFNKDSLNLECFFGALSVLSNVFKLKKKNLLRVTLPTWFLKLRNERMKERKAIDPLYPWPFEILVNKKRGKVNLLTLFCLSCHPEQFFYEHIPGKKKPCVHGYSAYSTPFFFFLSKKKKEKWTKT